MDNLLRVLIVEDSDDDTQMLLREMEHGGYKPVYQRVETDTAMREALDEQSWDIVIADYSLPHFSAPAALVLLKEAGLDMPFIVVSGAIGEETAVAVMKLGANDYVMKNNLPRLIPAVERELRDADVRREHRLAEQRLRQAAQEWRTTFDSIADWVSIHDRDFRITRLNRSCAAAFGKHPRELVGRTCYKLIHGTDEPVKECPHVKTMKTGKPAVGEFYDQHMHCYLEVATSPVINERGEVVASVHITRDITGRKHMEGQLLIADRLASIGELSAGIAHEINNPLTSVLGFTELLMDRELPEDIRENIELISQETERASGIVRNLLTFSRGHDEAREMININDVIASVLELRSLSVD
ncbi:MAG: histidine kinase dimerization/phospho-acceptor domain-containing protein [Dehalococcoidales bacterium]